METTAIGIDARGYLSDWLEMVSGMMVSDIKAIPDEKWTEPFGGCTRASNSLLADTVTFLNWTEAAMKEKESDAYDHMKELAETFADKQLAIDSFIKAVADFKATLAAASDETLNKAVKAPWQAPTPIFMLATIAVNHIWYHDGQLNYVQCILGDGAVHWMGE
jgi:hypothetical protein